MESYETNDAGWCGRCRSTLRRRCRRKGSGDDDEDPAHSHTRAEDAVTSEFSLLTAEQVAEHERVKTHLTQGLTQEEAEARLKLHGPNKLSEQKREPFYKKVLRQLNSVIYFVLVAAAIISAVVQEWAEAVLIAVVILGNLALSLYLEGKAEESIRALKQLMTAKATVVRGGSSKGSMRRNWSWAI